MLMILTPLIFLFGDFSPLLEKRLLIVLVIGIGISLVSWIDDMDTIGRSPVRVPPIVRLLMQISV
jgi:UDP-N-acetylmuramyl pentapeptide phosphotransferase/UDP-N-acetylglucosamine-1-phosphate transferase